jgi:MFS family permease
MTSSATAVRPRMVDRAPEARVEAAPERRRVGARPIATLALASSMVISFLAASAAPSPLYDRYERLWHATPLIGTIAFAVYALAVLGGLLSLGELPALLGRRPVLLAAIAGQIIALVLFAVAGSFTLILIGRVVQGIAAGAALGALSATMIESEPTRGTIASAASPGAGSGLGAILSGLAVTFLPAPTHTIYVLLIVVMTLQALGVVRLIPAVPRRSITRASLFPRVAVARKARPAFTATAPVMFAVWGLAGFYAALSPALYVALTGSDSVWQSVLGLFLFAGVASVSTIVLQQASGRALTITGAAAMLAGLAVTIVAIALDSIALYFVASVVVGIGFGTGFQGPIRTLVPLATPEERPGLLSAVFVVAYLGMAIPAVIAGALVSGVASLTTVAIAVAIALALLSAGALVATVRAR